MATGALIPLSEYLTSSYEVDCDYIDGELQERNLGEQDHSDLQSCFIELLSTPAAKEHLRVNPELRVQVSPTRYRVPDLCIRLRSAPSERIIRTPPLLCIEILSPEDRASRTREKVRDFLDMGVREVWVVDPALRTVTTCSGATTVEHTSGSLTVPQTQITLALPEIFKVLDEYD
jgi:Uma2 family endonuclease